MHRPGRDQILGVAPLLVLHQQRLKVIPAVIPPLLATEGGRKEGVEFLKAVVDPLEARRIHHPNHPTSSVQPSYQTTRRCSTRSLAGKPDSPQTRFHNAAMKYGCFNVIHVLLCRLEYV